MSFTRVESALSPMPHVLATQSSSEFYQAIIKLLKEKKERDDEDEEKKTKMKSNKKKRRRKDKEGKLKRKGK